MVFYLLIIIDIFNKNLALIIEGEVYMNKIITISREFGSGGREIGKRLADELQLAYYDREIISKLAKETGMTEEYIKNISEKGIYPYAFQFAKSFAVYSKMQSEQTQILIEQQKLIKKIAEKGNCIIVGRGANIILKELKTIDIFVYSDMKSKIERCRKKNKDSEKLSDRELEQKIIQIDKNRKNYHKILMNNLEWGDKRIYDLCINTAEVEIKNIISPLAEYIKGYYGGN